MMCADLVEVRWKDKSGRSKKAVANLEDISLSGACLQVDIPIPRDTMVRITYPKGEFEGKIRYCIYREIGYFVGVQFVAGTKWSRRRFQPRHLLDLGRLAARGGKRAGKDSPPAAQ